MLFLQELEQQGRFNGHAWLGENVSFWKIISLLILLGGILGLKMTEDGDEK